MIISNKQVHDFCIYNKLPNSYDLNNEFLNNLHVQIISQPPTNSLLMILFILNNFQYQILVQNLIHLKKDYQHYGMVKYQVNHNYLFLQLVLKKNKEKNME